MDFRGLPMASTLLQYALSLAISPAPLSLATCLSPDNAYDIDKYWQYTVSHMPEQCVGHQRLWVQWLAVVSRKPLLSIFNIKRPYTNTSQELCFKLQGHQRRPSWDYSHKKSGWYHAYVDNYLLQEGNSIVLYRFCNRFYLPHTNNLILLNQIIIDNIFNHWHGYKSNGKKSSPIEILVLRLLRFLGHSGIPQPAPHKSY
jgi:hypothetical protein